MASCNDCVHVEVCSKKNLHVAVGMNITPRFKYKHIQQECEHFKDRARFVALPCMVGDTVYVIESIAGEEKIIQDHVETLGIGYYADGINIYQFDGVKTDGYFEDFGKTVFLTREEAEQALKEREKNGQGTDDRGSRGISESGI